MSSEDEEKKKSAEGGSSSPAYASVDAVPTARRLGPAARARAEGKSYDVKMLRSAMMPLANDDGTPRSKTPAPYLPVLDACSICPARCCRFNVKVSLPDALRYTRIMGLPFFAGLTLVPSEHPTHAFEVVRDSRIVGPDEGWTGKAEIQLRRREDGSCHALVDIGGYDRCSAYDARPSVCRLYPFSWTSNVAKGSPGMIACPVPYAVTESAERRFVEDAERSIEDWELHDDVIEEWHALPLAPEARTVDAFLVHAIRRTEVLTGQSAGPALAKGNANQRLYEAMITSQIVRPPRR